MIIVLTGPMKSGKSATLINRIREYRAKGYEVTAYKPDTDTRSVDIVSRNGEVEPCNVIPSDNISILEKHLSSTGQVIAIEEFQFVTDFNIKKVLTDLSISDNIVILSGLETTSELEEFGFTTQMTMLADEVVKIHGDCEVCETKGTAIFTSANFSKAGQVMIGDSEYKSVCRKCYHSVACNY